MPCSPAVPNLHAIGMECRVAVHTLQPCDLLVQMVVRSPFLLGLSHPTLTARMQALRAALPDADVQRMAQYCPSLLEVWIQTCCMCLSSSTLN